jgi:hypothetical protein
MQSQGLKGLNVTSDGSLQVILNNLPNSAPQQGRLMVLVAASISELAFAVPYNFTELDIISCGAEILNIRPESTYCGIRLYDWMLRESFLAWNVPMNNGVCFLPPEPTESGIAPLDLTKRDAIKVAMKLILQEVKQGRKNNTNPSLPWAASGVRVASSVVSRLIRVRHDGIVIPTTITNAARQYLTVFFVPFKLVAKWMMYAWPHFIKLIKAVWNFFMNRERLQTFLESCFLALSALQHAQHRFRA